MHEAVDVDAFSEKGLIWRLVIQLRIPQTAQPAEAKSKIQARTVETAVRSALATDSQFKKAVAALREYNDRAPHTFIYGLAILSTLHSQAISAGTDPITYAATSGVIIQGMACKEYLTLAAHNPDLLQSPLSFNELNRQLAADVAASSPPMSNVM